MDMATGFGLILSLLSFYLRSKDKREAAEAQEFYDWLIEHKFQDVKDCITRNYILMSEVENLLKENQDTLLQRFDGVDEKLMRILHTVEGFEKIAETIAPETCLSKRQQQLLSVMVHSEATEFYRLAVCPPWLGFKTNGKKTISPDEIDTKFLEVNLAKLCEKGFLMWNGKNTYYLTEDGQDYIDNLDKKSEQEI